MTRNFSRSCTPARRPRPSSWTNPTLGKSSSLIPPQRFGPSSVRLRSVFDPPTHPGQRCLLLFRKNIIVQPARAALHNSQLVPWPLRSCRKRGGGHLGEEGLEAPAYDEGLYLLPPQTPRSNDGPAAMEKTVGERLPKVRWFRTGGCCPPSIAPNKVFKNTTRGLFGRVVQTVTSHGYTGRYYQRFVPTESPWCTCTDKVSDPTLQTRHHIICECPRYEAFRNILRKNHPNLHAHNFSLRRLFDPHNGLHDLIHFIHKSGAFTKTGVPHPEPDPD